MPRRALRNKLGIPPYKRSPIRTHPELQDRETSVWACRGRARRLTSPPRPTRACSLSIGPAASSVGRAAYTNARNACQLAYGVGEAIVNMAKRPCGTGPPPPLVSGPAVCGVARGRGIKLEYGAHVRT
ncbi:hypothetical protein BDY21DRAFT_337326 [Lineolata rhizophorae]|uniref:Uncharacterized protein n=1 Tax=Lineolata rhizophorae TaxID=578093 RepID=A0A6A6P7T1_9PEZI|nr:hypothetical protein BDY21DRAFT_337326 [Lineolata rhizophorae]